MRSEKTKKPTCILVLGMHRSGTSAFTRAINLLGVGLPERMLLAGADNPSGFWEPQELVELNDALLAELGSAWYDWRSIKLQDADVGKIVDTYKPQIADAIKHNFGDEDLFVLKDPRICRLSPVYEDVLSKAGYEVRFLLPVRHPMEVARSLEARNGFPLSQGLLLWLRHILDAELTSRTKIRSIVSYDDLLREWQPVLESVSRDLKVSWKRDYDEAAAEMRQFLDGNLKHHSASLEQSPQFDETTLAWGDEVFSILSAPLSAKELKRLDEIRTYVDLISPIVYAHHFQLLVNQATLPDLQLTRLYDIQSAILDVQSRQVRSTLAVESRNAELTTRLLNLSEKVAIHSEKMGAMEAERDAAIETVREAEVTNSSLKSELAQLTEKTVQLDLTIERLFAETQAAERARTFAEQRCEDLSKRYWHDMSEDTQSEILPTPAPLRQISGQSGLQTETADAQTSSVDGADTLDSAPRILSAATETLKYDVVIPLHNSVHWLALCLEELFRYQHEHIGEVIVVNDRSDIDQAAQATKIVARFPSARLIENKAQHGGFGHACNLGAAAGTSPLIVFLNTDCLVTENALDLLAETLSQGDDLGLACPVSNNSPLLTYPMFPGRSYIDMAQLTEASGASAKGASVLEACTIVGNCLMVKRDFFEGVNGFSPEWREGYGEETELQMMAIKYGLKGVVDLRSYVFHFGGGTFNYLEGADELRLTNHKRFMDKWRKEYNLLERRVRTSPPIESLDANLRRFFEQNPDKEWPIDVDVLFYLPGLRQDIGGLSAVVSICNALVRSGIRATCALVGPDSLTSAMSFKEPILFNFLTYLSDAEFLQDNVIRPRIVFSTIFTSAAVVAQFAEARNCLAAQFVQGYEPFFENGKRRPEVLESYKKTNLVVTTSSWLAGMVAQHLREDQTLIRLPLLPNPDIFFAGSQERDIDVCVVLRGAPDKGQWLLLEIISKLEHHGRNIVVVSSSDYAQTLVSTNPKVSVIPGPLDHYALGRLFRRTKVFLDASHHEGYGLLPMEAALCGCHIVVSDSGGVRDMRASFSVDILPLTADPQPFVDAVQTHILKSPESTLIQDSNDLWRNYNSNIEKWVTTIRDQGRGVEPIKFRRKASSPAAFSPAMHRQPGTFKQRALVYAYRRYLIIKPYLPKRLTHAMRMLILGR